MRAVWLFLWLSLLAAGGYVWWYWAEEKAANAPATFLNLVAMAGTLCSVAAGLALAQVVRKIKAKTE